MKRLNPGIISLAVLFLLFGGGDVQPKLCPVHHINDFCWIDRQVGPNNGNEYGK